jgi:hypothetical protein
MDYRVIGWRNDHYTKLSHWFTRGTGNGWAETDFNTSHTLTEQYCNVINLTIKSDAWSWHRLQWVSKDDTTQRSTSSMWPDLDDQILQRSQQVDQLTTCVANYYASSIATEKRTGTIYFVNSWACPSDRRDSKHHTHCVWLRSLFWQVGSGVDIPNIGCYHY